MIFLVDAEAQTVTLRDAFNTMHYSREDIVAHPTMPDFALHASELFERIKPKP